jgi:hypothetical protein
MYFPTKPTKSATSEKKQKSAKVRMHNTLTTEEPTVTFGALALVYVKNKVGGMVVEIDVHSSDLNFASIDAYIICVSGCDLPL